MPAKKKEKQKDIPQPVSAIITTALVYFGIPVIAFVIALLALIYAIFGWARTVDAVPAVSGFGAVIATAVFFALRAPLRGPGVPGPPVLPFFGNLITYITHYDRQPDWIYELSVVHGKNHTRAWTWTIPKFRGISCGKITCLCTPANVKHVLRDNFENYTKGPFCKASQYGCILQRTFLD